MPNLFAQIVFIHVFFMIIDGLLHKIRSILPTVILKSSSFKYIKHLVMFVDKFTSSQSNKRRYCSLNTFRIIWLTMSILLVEPFLVPVIMFNVLMERLLNTVFVQPVFVKMDTSDKTLLFRQIFFKLSTYTIFAYSSFYQMANTNGLSTISVSSCFVGLNSYIPQFCVLFMVISIYTTYVYWFLMFFIRLKEDFFIYEDYINITEYDSHKFINTNSQDKSYNFTKLKRQIVFNYFTFYSIVNVILIIRFLIMSINMTITFILRDHLFIWSVICPKFLYEFCFTILVPFIVTVMVMLFTIDNLFLLN